MYLAPISKKGSGPNLSSQYVLQDGGLIIFAMKALVRSFTVIRSRSLLMCSSLHSLGWGKDDSATPLILPPHRRTCLDSMDVERTTNPRVDYQYVMIDEPSFHSDGQ